MSKGESSRERVRWQIQKVLLNGPATSTKIIETCDAAKATVYKYLNELCEEGEVIWKPPRKRGESSTYELSNEAKDEVKLLLEKQDFKTEIDQMGPQFFQELKKFLDFLVESEKGEEFWLWLPDIDHPEKIKKFKNVGTKVLRQD